MALIIDRTTPLALSEIVGDILSALVRGQAQAAQTTVEYIDAVGFRRQTPTDTPTLRSVEFSYQKLDENQQSAAYRVQIPLLSMVDIPLICIRKATIKLDYEVSNLGETSTTTSDGRTTKVPQLKGRVLSGRAPAERAAIAVSVEIEKAEMPPGLARALDVLELAVNESKQKVSP